MKRQVTPTICTKATPRLNSFSEILDDFANAPFRLFFLTACLPAILGASCWTLAYLDVWVFATGPLDLHAFFFLQSLAGIAFAGFFFTAVPEWTGDATPLGNYMKPLWIVWFVASSFAPLSLAMALSLMVCFWGYILAVLSWLIWRNRDDRQISVVIMIAVVALLTLRLAIKSWQPNGVDSYDWQQQLHAIVLGIALISFRIGRALGNQALEDNKQLDSQFIPNPFIKNLSVWLFYILLLNNLLIHNSIMEGWLSLAIAGAMCGRLRDWHFIVLLKRHYVRWLYMTIMMIAIGYAWRGLALIEFSATLWLADPVMPLHIIAIGGFLSMLYQVINIAGLRHSNRHLAYPLTSRLALLALIIASLSRATGDLFPLAYYLHAKIYLPNLLVALAFCLYFPVFYRIFVRYEATQPQKND